MTKEELYKEFLEVTHFDERFIVSYERFTNMYATGGLCASEFEGLMIRTKNPDGLGLFDSPIIITYFHNEQEPKTGHWECNELFYEDESRGAIIRCSKCGNEFKVSPKVFENLYDNERFCNHCGCRMESEE